MTWLDAALLGLFCVTELTCIVGGYQMGFNHFFLEAVLGDQTWWQHHVIKITQGHYQNDNSYIRDTKICQLSVIAKYAGHVRQTSDGVRQRDQTLPDILSSRVQYTLNVWQGKQEWLLIFASHQLGKMSDRGSKCPAGRWRPAGHFVRQARNNFCDHWSAVLLVIYF